MILQVRRETREDGRRARQGSKRTLQDSLLFIDHNKEGTEQYYEERLRLMCVWYLISCRIWPVVTRNNDVYFGHALRYCFHGDTDKLHRQRRVQSLGMRAIGLRVFANAQTDAFFFNFQATFRVYELLRPPPPPPIGAASVVSFRVFSNALVLTLITHEPHH